MPQKKRASMPRVSSATISASLTCRHAAHVGAAAEVAAGAVRGEAKPVLGIAPARDQDRLAHVERDQGQAVGVVREVGRSRRGALGVVEQAVDLAEDEIVLVPETALDFGAEIARDQVMDREVVALVHSRIVCRASQ